MSDDVLKISIQHSLSYIKAYNHQRLLAIDKQFIHAIENLDDEDIESHEADETSESGTVKNSTSTGTARPKPRIEENTKQIDFPIDPISGFNFYLPYVFTSIVILWIFFIAN